jgi:hypothetical protein
MARIRSVHPGLFRDEAFMELSMGARVLLIGVWTIADDHGVFEWKPKAIRAEVFPSDNVEMEAILDELVTQRCVVRFEDSGRAYAVVRNFCVYQRPREPSYRFPFPQDVHSLAGVDRRKAEDLVKAGSRKPIASVPDCNSADAGLPQDQDSPSENHSHRREEKGREEKGVNSKTDIESLERAPLADEKPALAPVALSQKSNFDFGSLLPEKWTPSDELCEEVKSKFGMTDDSIQLELEAFHAHAASNGIISKNWNTSFVTWCKRWKEHRDKQAPPRVQLSNVAEKRPEEFTEAEWEKIVSFYAKTGRWQRHAGPDPMSRACKAPRAMLDRHGIDELGERRIPAKTVSA